MDLSMIFDIEQFHILSTQGELYGLWRSIGMRTVGFGFWMFGAWS